MKRILVEAGGIEPATIYLDWVHESQDTWARQLRGEVAWPGGDTVKRMDPVSLGRNLTSRLDQALDWDAKGRQTAPKATNGRHVPSLSDDLRALREWEDYTSSQQGVIDVH